MNGISQNLTENGDRFLPNDLAISRRVVTSRYPLRGITAWRYMQSVAARVAVTTTEDVVFISVSSRGLLHEGRYIA
jgi:hypothetical protein